MSYGGNSYTLHVNEGIPLERAVEIENGFKELHAGMYEWGNMMFIEALSVGYIQSVDGWRLALPKFDLYQDSVDRIAKLKGPGWVKYGEGKKEYKKLQEIENYKVVNQAALTFYRNNVNEVSSHYKLRSEYQRLCLNSPVQTCGSHQLKRASVMFFDWIVANKLQWKVKICNSVHDEIVLEALDVYAEKARLKLQQCMVDGGNHYLDELTIKADAHSGRSWYEAK